MSSEDFGPGPSAAIDKRLRQLFRAIDTSSAFEAQVLARIHTEGRAKVSGEIAQAQEEERYRQTRRALESWRRAAMRMVALDALGTAAVLAAITAWLLRSSVGMPDLLQTFTAMDGAALDRMVQIATCLGLVLAAVPVWILKVRR